MSGIIWLASYPKSGNTWMRALLANYLVDGEVPVSVNRLGGGPIASARAAFDDHVGVESSDLLPEEIERLRPAVYEQIAQEAEAGELPLFLKVHDAFTRNAAGEPLLSKRAAGVLYLLRNPLDVAVSFAHHSGASVERMVENMGNPRFGFVMDRRRIFNQLEQKLLSWSGHVLSWVDEPGLAVHTVRYEDLSADTTAVLSAALEFAGIEPEPDRVERAVSFSDIEELRAQEEEHGFDEKPLGMASFFRKGQVGGWREELAPELAERLIADHGPVMRRFGYLDDDGRPVY